MAQLERVKAQWELVKIFNTALSFNKFYFYSSINSNLLIVYELETWSGNLDFNFTLNDCLFEGAKLAKNADPDKYVYSGYGVRLDLFRIFITWW